HQYHPAQFLDLAPVVIEIGVVAIRDRGDPPPLSLGRVGAGSVVIGFESGRDSASDPGSHYKPDHRAFHRNDPQDRRPPGRLNRWFLMRASTADPTGTGLWLPAPGTPARLPAGRWSLSSGQFLARREGQGHLVSRPHRKVDRRLTVSHGRD